jgi:hypothetical protein
MAGLVDTGMEAYQRRLSFEQADPDDDRKRRLSLRPVGDRLYARSEAHVLHIRRKRSIRLTEPMFNTRHIFVLKTEI